ncbi:hypothetical protein KAR10_07425 [bacterium]|nr:hypothetical protein [bacterium]
MNKKTLMLLFVIGFIFTGRLYAVTPPENTPTHTAISTDTATPFVTTITAIATPTVTPDPSAIATATHTPTPFGTSITMIATPTVTPDPSVIATATHTPTPFGTSITMIATPTVTPDPSVITTATITITPDDSALTAAVTLTPVTTPTSYVTIASAAPVVIKQNIVRPSMNKPVHIDVKIAEAQRVVVKIYSLRGKLIKTLADRVADAGTFETVWEGVSQKGVLVSSGIYIVHIKTDTFDEKRKLAVVR